MNPVDLAWEMGNNKAVVSPDIHQFELTPSWLMGAVQHECLDEVFSSTIFKSPALNDVANAWLWVVG